MIKRLTIVNGIIQDEFLDGIPIYVDIIKKVCKGNVRTGIKVKAMNSTTTHNTGNSHPTATDKAHLEWLKTVEEQDKEYIGAALFVDSDSITQVLPLDEVVYHSGNSLGNSSSISVEICENEHYKVAEKNAIKLIAAINVTLNINHMYPHQHWNGKYCPRVILDGGYWESYKLEVVSFMKIIKAYESLPEWAKDCWEWGYDNGLNDGIVQNPFEIQVMKILYNYHKKFVEKD